MRRKISLKPITLLLLLLTFVSYGKEDKQHSESGSDLRTEIKEYVQHHLLDSYDFNLFSYENGEKHFGFSLPVILWDNGLKVFSSSKFHHGETIAEVGGDYYKLYHNKVYKTDANGTINYDAEHHPTNAKPLDFSITKNVVLIMIVFAIMFFMFSRMAKSYKKNNGMPKGMGRFLEPIVLYVRDEIAIPNIGEKHYKRYMSYLLTVFFFVWIVNLFGLTPIGMNVTNNIAVTLCLALITYFITTFSGNKNYWKHIFWMPGVPVPMKIILAPIELLGTIIKPFALMIRLYANITAGHVVLMSIIGMMFIFNNWLGSSLSFLLAFVLGILELLVAALQAYIFTVLSALYFGMAVEEHDHH
ncbi:F0F1 ATP synthase subunit A [Hyunsoonleella aestuarii]|uniref:ATP synthase subunit a n=1 Tax=Hyunsoonleella aestuarii TaxID=912802 RepID=A0ABP8E9Q3_9FLAO|nr:F0F1 ATP synthase subunit A [Hyunsoonleella aestuarii]